MKIIRLVSSIASAFVAGAAGSFFTAQSVSTWYVLLEKPALNPPAWVFGPVWTTLYVLIGVAFYIVWQKDFKITTHFWKPGTYKSWNTLSPRLWIGDLAVFNIIAIYILQLFLNASWSLVFFGLKNPACALFVLVALWVSIVYTIINFYRVSKTAAYLLLPYIIWVSFALYLNYAIWILNLNI